MSALQGLVLFSRVGEVGERRATDWLVLTAVGKLKGSQLPTLRLHITEPYCLVLTAVGKLIKALNFQQLQATHI